MRLAAHLRRAALLLGLAVVAGLLVAQSAAALDLSTPVTPGSGYLALGDSVTFGYEEPTVTPPPDYSDAASFLGYPEQLGARLHLNVTNLACPGETSASLIDVTAPSLGCEDAYRLAFPLHVDYTGAQLAYAVNFLSTHHNVKLVSLMIGANDGFLCQAETTDQCGSASEQSALSAKVAGDVHTILSAIRNSAHYGGQIAIVNYYSLDYAVPAFNAESQLLNNAQDSAAQPFHVEVADGFGAFQAASSQSAGDPCLAGLLTQTGPPGTCGIHPSHAGQAVLAAALASAIRSEPPVPLPAPSQAGGQRIGNPAR